MRLIVGGTGQGKLAYAMEETACPPQKTADGASCTVRDLRSCRVFDHLHLFIRREMQAGRDPWTVLSQALEENPEIVIVCDEIGCGIVPADPFERAWRERTGRICCELARRARRVERVFCGCVQVLREENA